jgi:ATP:ADP antiporter, AAA family
MGSMGRRVFRLIADVRSDEVPAAALMALHGFVLMMAYSCIKPVREALILAHPGGAEDKAYMAGATALILLLAVPLYSRASRGLPRNRLVIGTTAFFATHLLAFYAVGMSMGSSRSFALAFYLWIAVFNMMIVTQFWSFASDLYTEEAGRRLFPLLGFGVSLGAVAGAATARLLIGRIGGLSMMPLAAAMLLLSATVSQWVHVRDVRHAASAEARAAAMGVVGGRPGDAFRAIIGNRYLLYIAGFSLLFTLVKTNGDYVLARAVENTANKAVAAGALPVSGVPNYIGSVFADVTFWTDTISLLLQGLVVSRIVTHAGFRIAFLTLPIVALGDASLMATWPILMAVRIGKTAESAIDYSLNNTVRHMLWLPTSRRDKYLAKQATDTVFVRAGDIASAGLIFVVTRMGLSPRAVPASNLILIVVWFALATAILAERRRLLEPSARAHGQTRGIASGILGLAGLTGHRWRRVKSDDERTSVSGLARHGDGAGMPIDNPLRQSES